MRTHRSAARSTKRTVGVDVGRARKSMVDIRGMQGGLRGVIVVSSDLHELILLMG